MTARVRRRGMGLAPLIDVVFLLLVFFLLAARHQPALEIPMSPEGRDEGRLLVVDVGPVGQSLNGASMNLSELGERARKSAADGRSRAIVRPRAEATVQRTIEVLDALRNAGLVRLAVAP